MEEAAPETSASDLGLDDFSPEELESGRLLFAGECHFIAASNSLDNLPPLDLPEVAFAGRSNVGKSSLVNALTGRRTLARSSQTLFGGGNGRATKKEKPVKAAAARPSDSLVSSARAHFAGNA